MFACAKIRARDDEKSLERAHNPRLIFLDTHIRHFGRRNAYSQITLEFVFLALRSAISFAVVHKSAKIHYHTRNENPVNKIYIFSLQNVKMS